MKPEPGRGGLPEPLQSPAWSLVKLPNEREYKWPPALTGGVLEVSALLTRAMRTDDGSLLFSAPFNDSVVALAIPPDFRLLFIFRLNFLSLCIAHMQTGFK